MIRVTLASLIRVTIPSHSIYSATTNLTQASSDTTRNNNESDTHTPRLQLLHFMRLYAGTETASGFRFQRPWDLASSIPFGHRLPKTIEDLQRLTRPGHLLNRSNVYQRDFTQHLEAPEKPPFAASKVSLPPPTRSVTHTSYWSL